jgi:site-specific DNA-cytosine methylase
MKQINVVSLFNGMNTGRLALENCGFSVGKYYSSEIKKSAIKLTQHHYPDTIQVGDVTQWKSWEIDWSSIDLILSGSPCQDLSVAGKRTGVQGDKSSLFFTFIEILEHCRSFNPNVKFMQENVGSADVNDIGVMSRELGVYPVRINSSLLTAQMRDRYYWTNIRTKKTLFDEEVDIPQPIDRGITFASILESGSADREKSTALCERYRDTFYADNDSEISQNYLRKRSEKSICPVVIQPNGLLRTLSKIEMCRLQGFPDNYCDSISRRDTASLLGDGWTLPVIEHIFSFWKI